MLKHLFTLLLLLAGTLASAGSTPFDSRLFLRLDGTLSDYRFSQGLIFRNIDRTMPQEAAYVEVLAKADELVVLLIGNVPGEKIRVGKGDGPYAMFGGDTAEVFLQPEPGSGTYYHFALDSAGRTYMAKNGDSRWTPPVKVDMKAQVFSERKWSAVFIIPFAALSAAVPQKETEWKANFVFGKSWAQTSDYHDPGQFGTLVFGKSADTDVLDSMRLEDGGKKLVYKFIGKEEQTVLCGGRGHKNIGFYEVRHGDTVHRFLAPGMNFNDAVKLDKFYYNAGEPVQITADSNTFVLRDGSGKITKISGKEIKNLPAGPYNLTDEAANCTVSFLVQNPVSEIPQPTGKLGILNNRVLTADGKPFYPVMLSDAATAKPFLHIIGGVSCGFAREPVTGYLFNRDTDEQVKHLAPFVNRTAKVKLPVLHRILYESQLPLMVKDKDGSITVEADQAKFYQEIYQKFKTAYPDRIFSIHADGNNQLKERAEACDVFEYASWGSGYASAVMPSLKRDIEQLRYYVPEKPVLLWLGGSIAGNSQRTAEELRCAIFLSLVRNCAGNVIHLGHGGIPKERKAIWSLMNGIQQEINRIYPDFVSGKDVTEKYAGGRPEMFYLSARERKDGSLFIVAVNTSHLPVTFRQWYFAPYDARIIEIPGVEK